MVESTIGVSAHRTRVVGLSFIVLKKHKELEMLVRVFLRFMQE